MSISNFLSQLRFPLLFCIVCLSHFVVDFSVGLWPIWKTMSAFPLATAGFVASVCVLIGEGMQGVFSLFADRGYSRMLIAGGIIIASASLGFPLTDGLFAAGVLYFLTCLGSSAFHPAAVGFVSTLSASSHMPVAIAIFQSCGLFGLAVGQSIFSSLHGVDAFLPLIGGGILIAFLLLLMAYTQRDGAERAKGKDARESGNFRMFLQFFRRPDLRAIYFLLLYNQIMGWSFIFLLPDFLMERGFDVGFSQGGGHFVYTMGAACACIPLGMLASRLNIPRVIFWTTIAAVLLFFATILVPGLHVIAVGALLFFLGGAVGATTPLSLALGTSLETNHRAAISAFLMGGVWIFSEGIGLSLGPHLTTYFDKDPIQTSLAIMGVFLILAAFQSATLLKLSRREQGTEQIAEMVSQGHEK